MFHGIIPGLGKIMKWGSGGGMRRGTYLGPPVLGVHSDSLAVIRVLLADCVESCGKLCQSIR